MSTSLFPTPVPRRKYPVEFKAGKLIREENMLKADERKGLIYMDQGEDQLMHFYWKDRKTGKLDDLIVFPDEAEFTRVEQCTTGRVYLLHFKSSNQNLFFWMQDAKDDKDEENANKVNRLLNDPQGGLAESRQHQSGSSSSPFRTMDDLAGFNMDQEQLLQLLRGHGAFGNLPIPSTTPASEPQSATAATSEAGSGAQTSEHLLTSEQLNNLKNILSGVQLPEEGTSQTDVNLTNVLNPSIIGPLLNDPEIASALFPNLPSDVNRTPEELIQSPQFAQALQSLNIALQSGQLSTFLNQLGLDPSAGNGVEAFLRALQEQASRHHGEHRDDNEEQSGDRMEED